MSPGSARSKRGKLIVVSAPSGSGKTTIATEIMRRNPSLGFSVSATTRRKRVGEVEGKDYYFLSTADFLRKADAGEFVEWEELYGDYYGTLKSEIQRAVNNDKSLLFDVDVNGALAIKQQYPDACLIFIRPPSLAVLRTRLLGRHTEDEISIGTRMERVPMELEKGNHFDHQVVNDDLAYAIEEVSKIVQKHLEQ